MKSIKILDILILALIIFAAAFSMKKSVSPEVAVVMVDADGESYEFKLSENKIHNVQGPLGTTSIEVKDGKVRIIDSPCPGKTCINQGWTSPIVCLPNKVVVRVIDYGEFDGYAE